VGSYSKPKLHLPQIKLTRTLEQLIPGILVPSILIMELQGIEVQLRELLVTLSHLKWVLDNQLAFYMPLASVAQQEGAKVFSYYIVFGFRLPV